MKQFIYHVLKKTASQYQNTLFDIYVTYCGINSVSTSDLQQLIISQKLWNWFYTQIELLEDEFIEVCSNPKTINMTDDDLFILWKKSMIKILEVYPKQILLQIRKDARAERVKNSFRLEHYNSQPLYLN